MLFSSNFIRYVSLGVLLASLLVSGCASVQSGPCRDSQREPVMPDLFERVLLLKQAPIFSQVMTDDLRHVARALEERQFLNGDTIFEINQHGDHLFIIVSGRVGISLENNGSDRKIIAEFGPGDCFGEMNLLDDLPRSATAHVMEDTTVLALDKARLRALILSYPELSIGMLRGLSMRLREANRAAFPSKQEQGSK